MRSSIRFLLRLSAWILFVVAFTAISFADRAQDRTQVGHNISIGLGEETSDATCFGCSIRVRGHVAGDVTALGGSIIVEDQGQVDGDATALGGGIRLDSGVTVHGDVTAIGGRILRDPAATVGGDVNNMAGPGWIALIVLISLLPFVFLGLFVALIVWLIRRLLRRPAAPIAAQPMR
jgi:hypothetical protein